MSGQNKVEKAQLREVNSTFDQEINNDKWLTVQFNPESLKVSFANQIQQPQGGSDQGGGAAQQFVGAGTTKLTVQLWFDVSSDENDTEADVRELTKKVAYFITPQPEQGQSNKFRPPILRFIWGSFQFDGIVESMEEALEYFSPEGRPLRASVALNVSQQKIQFEIRQIPPPNADGTPPVGTQPLTTPPPDQSFQQTQANSGGGNDWQGNAEANNIDNPRFPPSGQPLDLNAGRR